VLGEKVERSGERQQVVNLARASAARKKAGYVGKRNDTIWANVNIKAFTFNDLADLYLVVLNGLLNGTADHGKHGGWYFGTVYEHTWVKVGHLLAK